MTTHSLRPSPAGDEPFVVTNSVTSDGAERQDRWRSLAPGDQDYGLPRPKRSCHSTRHLIAGQDLGDIVAGLDEGTSAAEAAATYLRPDET